MEANMKRRWLSLSLITGLLLTIGVMVGCGAQPSRDEDEIVALGVTHISGLEVSGNETDELVVNQTSTGDIVEFRDDGSVVWRLADGGAVTQVGAMQLGNGSASAPAYSFSSDTDSGIYRIGANNVGVAVSATLISDWSSSSLDMNNLPVVNIGAAGTDFGADGSLTTAQTITVTAGGLVVTAGGATITAGGLDMTNDAITNIGAAGTDFGADGSLTTAQTITVTAGGLVVSAGGVDVQSGDITMENDETLSNATNGTITATVAASGFFDIAAGNLVVGDPSGASLTLNGNDAYVQGSLEADGLARLDGGVSMAGDLEISNGLFLPMFDDLTINDGDTITVTTLSVYGLDSSGDVTMTLAACAHDGQGVTLIGDDANTITINATNLRTTDGNALTLGQYDVIALICQDTEWLHVSKSANQ